MAFRRWLIAGVCRVYQHTSRLFASPGMKAKDPGQSSGALNCLVVLAKKVFSHAFQRFFQAEQDAVVNLADARFT